MKSMLFSHWTVSGTGLSSLSPWKLVALSMVDGALAVDPGLVGRLVDVYLRTENADLVGLQIGQVARDHQEIEIGTAGRHLQRVALDIGAPLRGGGRILLDRHGALAP